MVTTYGEAMAKAKEWSSKAEGIEDPLSASAAAQISQAYSAMARSLLGRDEEMPPTTFGDVINEQRVIDGEEPISW